MSDLVGRLADLASETGFSGVVRVDVDGRTEVDVAHGLADRAHAIPMTTSSQLGTASATKTMTALAVMALVDRGVLELATTARSLLGTDLPLVADDVTVEHLLAHESGIGDYLDESAMTSMTDHVMPVPVHTMASSAGYLPVLDGHPTAFPAGSRFEYNNGGYVVLGVLAERAAATPYADLVRGLVWEPAGMADSAFLRSDELPGRAARGYLEPAGLRTNVLHLPVVGFGDGGAFTTTADLHALWTAVHDGRVVSPERWADMVRPRTDWPEASRRYGLGVHLHATGDAVFMEGADAGVGCVSVHQPSTGTTFSVVSNVTDGAWTVARLLRDALVRP